MDIVESQFIALRKKYPYLYLDGRNIRGTIFIEGDGIKDNYEVEINIPRDYPCSIPQAREIGEKIPKDFHRTAGGALCLETPFTAWETFHKDEMLLNFVDNLLVPYLFSHSSFKTSGKMPLGERAHGAQGVLDDYKTRFDVTDDIAAFNLLRILAEDIYKGHLLCPCGAQRKLRDCHGKRLLAMKATGYDFMMDYLMIMCNLKNKKKINNTDSYMSKRVRTVLSSIKNNPEQKWGY